MSAPPRLDAPTRRTLRARWGLLATTVIMGVALVGTGLTTYLGTTRAADSVAEARTLDLFRALRRTLRDGADRPQAAVEDALADFTEQGLRFIAVSNRRGEVLAQAGVALGAAPPASGAGHASSDPADPPAGPGPPRIVHLGDRLRLDTPLAIGGHGGPRGSGRGLRLVIEVEPVMARELSAQARNHLLVSAAAAVLLLVSALFFWRLGARADRVEAQLARDRRLAALGEMSAVLGHELRNPLASLKGHAQLVLERTAPDARGYKNAERVVREAERLETLTRQILDFAKTGAVDRADVSPAELLRGAADQVADPRVTVDASAAPPTWALDRSRMEQVLVNLLKNAAQASPEGAAIDARCAAVGGALVFTVRDRGPGFPPGEAEAVFEPFRTHKVQGTGLGLPIARRIVEAHGGRIEALDAPDGGAVVRVTLPAAAAATNTVG